MMRVRPAVSGLTIDEAMARVVEIADGAALLRYLEEHYEFWSPTRANVKIEPYGFDERIGWDTHLITVDGKAALFSDGPLDLSNEAFISPYPTDKDIEEALGPPRAEPVPEASSQAPLDVALPLLKSARASILELVRGKHGTLPNSARLPLVRAIEAINEATGSLIYVAPIADGTLPDVIARISPPPFLEEPAES